MKRLSLTSLLTALCIIMLSFPDGHAQTAHDFSGKFTAGQINMKSGLSHNFVEDIFRDSKGYVWIATSGSLARYDGYEFLNFTPNSPASTIKSSFVRKVTEDKFGRLWIASDGGIDIINLENLSVAEKPFESEEFNRLASVPASFTTTDSKGNIWFRNNTNIVCISLTPSGDIAKIYSTPHLTTSPFTTGTIRPYQDGVLTGVGGEVRKLSLKKGKILSSQLSPQLSFDAATFISDFLETEDGIWVATDIGLYLFNPDTKNVRTYTGNPGPLSQNYVTSLAVTPDGHFVAGCLNGLNIYDRDGDTFHHVNMAEISSTSPSLFNNFINCLLVEGDNLWVGTEGNGIHLLSPKRLDFTFIQHNPASSSSLSPNPVNAIYEDSDGALWIGTVEGGLNRSVGGYSNGFSHYTRESGALPHNSVSAITADRSGHLWVGTWGGGIAMLDKDNPSRCRETMVAFPDLSHHFDYIGTLEYDPFNEALWIGASTGIFYYDLRKRELSVPFKGAADIKGCVASVITPEGKLCMGGINGLVAIDIKGAKDKKGFRIMHHPYKLDNPDSKVKEKITCLAISHDGNLWVGTNGNGIYRLDKSGGKAGWINYSTSDGLPNDVAHGIVEDLDHNIWIATYHGLSCLTPAGNFLNFGLNDGLKTEQFYWNAYRRLANGEVLFGSIDGMVAVKGIDKSTKRQQFPVTFTSLTVNGKKSFIKPTSLSIHERERSFEIGISALDFAGVSTGRYLYRLAGYDDKWHDLQPYRSSISYMNLPPGRYTLEVKYVARGENASSVPVSSIDIRVRPYFYKTWWFILSVIILVSLGIWLFYRWRTRELHRQTDRQKVQIEKMTLEVEKLRNNDEDSRDKKFSTKVQEVLRDNYRNSYFDVTAFSEAMGVSRTLLNKKLQALFGESANQLMRNYRLKVAYDLILENRSTKNMNISEIAFEVGFNDSKYFTRCFTKQYGLSPTALMKGENPPEQNIQNI